MALEPDVSALATPNNSNSSTPADSNTPGYHPATKFATKKQPGPVTTPDSNMVHIAGQDNTSSLASGSVFLHATAAKENAAQCPSSRRVSMDVATVNGHNYYHSQGHKEKMALSYDSNTNSNGAVTKNGDCGAVAADTIAHTACNKGVKANGGVAGNNDLLPTMLTPTHYDIHLHPDIDTGKVAGSVAITVTVNEPTSRIVLHAASMDISKVSVLSCAGALIATVGSESVVFDAHLETATISLPVVLGACSTHCDDSCGECPLAKTVYIAIEFVGNLCDSMYGLYRCKYKNRAGEPSFMLATQFQAKCARLAFPCWDEPAIKAQFSLSLIVPESHTTLSNMPIVDCVSMGGLKTVYFDRTPVMSTYLLAIVSGELDYVEGVAMSGPVLADQAANGTEAKRKPIVCRIYTPCADIDKVKFSLETAVKVLELLVGLFDYPYPLPKLDLVAVPELEAGGMENWGLVLFRTVRLFITKQTSLWIRQKAVYVIAHELSHQWFGNLVTMAWWDDLWLNEGFATWIGIYITDLLYPQWKRWDHFTIEDRQAALSADSLRSSHPIQVTIKGSADIDQVFDSITYYKGCSLIRMLSAHLGIDVFMAGVRAYLVAHEYRTATTNDLWRALELASKEPVGMLMHSWTTKVGYPVVTVDDDFGSGRVVLRQNRYLNSGKPSAEEDSVVWWIPLGMISSHSPCDKPCNSVMHERQAAFDIPGGSVADWVKLNYDNAGLYRVCYSREALRRLANAITNGELRSVDVVGILNDMVALVISGYLRTSALLDMIDAFQTVNGYVVWQIIGFFIESLHLTWADRSEAVRQQILQLCQSLFGPKAAALGWTHRADDGPLVARLRAISIPRAGWSGDTTVISQACQLFAEFYDNPDHKPFHHDFTASVFEIAVRSGPRENHARVREMYEHSQRWHLSEDHRMAALGAMSCTSDDVLREETLEYAMTDKVLPQDLNIVIGFMSSADCRSKHVLWRWFGKNYQRIVARLGESSALLGHVVSTVIGDFATCEMANEIQAWFSDKHTAAFDRMLPQSLEFIRVRAAWYERDCQDVNEWFGRHKEQKQAIAGN